jgi:hypothetical protein
MLQISSKGLHLDSGISSSALAPASQTIQKTALREAAPEVESFSLRHAVLTAEKSAALLQVEMVEYLTSWAVRSPVVGAQYALSDSPDTRVTGEIQFASQVLPPSSE